MNLPTKPLVRLMEYLNDGPFFQKRWSEHTAPHPCCEENALYIRSYNNILCKGDDPSWRSNMPWILLIYDDSPQYSLVYSEVANPHVCRKIKMPVQTRLFAMRVSVEPFWVSVIDNDSRGLYNIPKVITGDQQGLTKEDVLYVAMGRHEDVTFI